MTQATYTLGELASRFALELHGDAQIVISGLCTLEPGAPGCLGFLANPRYRDQLATTQTAAVIVGRRDVAALRTPGLVARDPYLAYARIAALFDHSRHFLAGTHHSAVIEPGAQVGEGAHVGAHCVISAGARIGARSYVGPNCVIGRDAQIGEGARLVAQVTISERVVLGARCHVQPGAVIGARGFGNAMGPQGWEEVPQLGSVVVGDDVEIGANTCIDRGSLDDTRIGNGVRLDNLIQVAHNCRIGDHTAIAACVGIGGSTRIGARCMIAGAVGIAGHLDIGDDVVILGMSMVTKSLPLKGVYGSGVPVAEARKWRKQIARMRRLEGTEARLIAVEQRLGLDNRQRNEGDEGGDDQDQL